MTAKKRKWLRATIGVVAAVAALLFHFKQCHSFRCQTCFAKKDAYQWRLGAWGGLSVPLSPRWEVILEDHFQRDLFSGDHVHDWVFAQGSPYHFFGTTSWGCALGAGRHSNDLLWVYEHSPEFREFIGQKLRDGSLTKSNVISLASIRRADKPSPLQKDKEELLEAYFAHKQASSPHPCIDKPPENRSFPPWQLP